MSAFFPDKRLAAFADLTQEEEQAVRSLAGPSTTIPAGRTVRSHDGGEPAVYVLHAGWIASALRLENGGCQILKIHLPSDIMSAPGLSYSAPVDRLFALTTVEVSEISLPALGRLFAEHPRIGALLFLMAQQEQLFLMERLASVGRTEAPARVAALLVHLHERLSTQLGETSHHIDVPLSQQQLGDVLGLSEVHVNRVLQQMERDGLFHRNKRQFEILRLDALRALTGVAPRKLRRNLTWLPPSQSAEEQTAAKSATPSDKTNARGEVSAPHAAPAIFAGKARAANAGRRAG